MFVKAYLLLTGHNGTIQNIPIVAHLTLKLCLARMLSIYTYNSIPYRQLMLGVSKSGPFDQKLQWFFNNLTIFSTGIFVW